MAILGTKALGHAVDAANRHEIVVFAASHLNDEYCVHLTVVTQIRNQIISLRVRDCFFKRGKKDGREFSITRGLKEDGPRAPYQLLVLGVILWLLLRPDCHRSEDYQQNEQ